MFRCVLCFFLWWFLCCILCCNKFWFYIHCLFFSLVSFVFSRFCVLSFSFPLFMPWNILVVMIYCWVDFFFWWICFGCNRDEELNRIICSLLWCLFACRDKSIFLACGNIFWNDTCLILCHLWLFDLFLHPVVVICHFFWFCFLLFFCILFVAFHLHKHINCLWYYYHEIM